MTVVEEWPLLTRMCAPDKKVEVENFAEKTVEVIRKAREAATPKKLTHHTRKPVYWRSQKVAELRKACLQLHRKAIRANKHQLQRINGNYNILYQVPSTGRNCVRRHQAHRQTGARSYYKTVDKEK